MYICWIVESPREASTRREAMAEAKLLLSHCNISEHTDVKSRYAETVRNITVDARTYI